MTYKISNNIIFCKIKANLKSPESTQKLSSSEKEIIDLLCIKNGDVVSKEELKVIGWPRLEVTDQSLTQAIYSLRKKLSLCGANDVIVTVFNQGYTVTNAEILSDDSLSLLPRSIYKIKAKNILLCFIFLLLPYILYERFLHSEISNEELDLLPHKTSYIHNGNVLTFISNEDISKDRKVMIEMLSEKIPTKSKVFFFMTNNKTYILACPLSNNATMCDSTVSRVLELPADEENIAPNKVKEWFSLQQEIKSESPLFTGVLPLFTGVIMSSTNYMFIDELLIITDKARFVLDFGSRYKKFKLKDTKYEGRYKGSTLYSEKSDKKNTVISSSGDFTFIFDKKVDAEALIIKNRTRDVIRFNRIPQEKRSKYIPDKHVIWKIEEWGNRSLWVSIFFNKMWLFEETPLY